MKLAAGAANLGIDNSSLGNTRSVSPVFRGIALLLVLLTTSCAMRHYGHYSVGYTDSSPPETVHQRLGQYPVFESRVKISELELRLSLGNEIRTGQYFWFLISRPFRGSMNDKWKRKPDIEGFCPNFIFNAKRPGIALKPLAAVITVDGVRREAFKTYPRLYETPGNTVLLIPGQSFDLQICFTGERPSPRRDIVLLLDAALQVPGTDAVPPIRFNIMRWIQDTFG